MGIKLVHQVLQLILRAKFALGMMAILKECDWYLGIHPIDQELIVVLNIFPISKN